MSCLALVIVVSLCANTSTWPQSVSDFAVRVSALVQTNPLEIALYWSGDPETTGITLYRKLRDATSWGTAIALARNATNYVDRNVTVGGAYEYRIAKSSSNYYGEGYIYAGIEVPLVENRGKVILLVDATQSLPLTNELLRLQQDLIGDGWTVLRHEVTRMIVDPASTNNNIGPARSNEIANIKRLVTTDYSTDPANVKTVFLFGRIPVPYSGNLAPDDHYDHVGAWPADGYYGSLGHEWSDSTENSAIATSSRNWNLPEDGKLDPSFWPYSHLALQVGRVDFANMPAFPVSETELLRRYLNKDHQFRHKTITAQQRGLIDDHFGMSTGEPLAASGWRNFAAFFGASNCLASSEWFSTLATNSFLWGFGCGAGTYTSASGIGTTADFVAYDPQVVFTMFFGSYFGDWDSENNFLRASLATPTFTLTSAWAGRPHWLFHHMALGETIGFSTRVTQNNVDSYDFNNFSASTHIALMGDPTLRMHIVEPPAALVVNVSGTNTVILSWNPSPEAVEGYHVYRSATPAGPYTRLNTELIRFTNYSDVNTTSCSYMVRAVKLEVSASGSFWNASQGIYKDYLPPVLTINAQNIGGGIYQIRGNGIPGVTYRIQATGDLENPIWTTVGEAIADESGVFVFIDYGIYAQRFYHSVYP
jgi:hypothetical protein